MNNIQQKNCTFCELIKNAHTPKQRSNKSNVSLKVLMMTVCKIFVDPWDLISRLTVLHDITLIPNFRLKGKI